ncbi:MAG: hybrid sensor histidine kinase/response regulator [Deltaproteobacteria bacterium]|nr:hybrid sensor histidine kinase/response regulator [Deltaproteobacteria bacterium]
MEPNAPRMDDSQDAEYSGGEALTRGVLHDIAGALTAIAGWAELALSTHAEREPALRLIRESAATAARLTQRLLGGRSDTWADPLELAQQVAQLLRPMAAERHVSIEVEATGGELPSLPEGACFSILWNLAHNAVALSAEGTRVRVQLRSQDAGLGISVVDAGPGMDALVKQRAFEPGFSRRPGGRGLGLSRVRELTSKLGGTIALHDAVGGGARVEVAIPRLERPARVLHQSGVIEREAFLPAGSGRLPNTKLLVVDDDDALRRMLVTALSRRGARCTEAGSVAQVNDAEGPWDLAFVDLTLGDGSGLELAERLRLARLAERVVCMSGQTSMPPGARFRPDAWLRKPFEPDDLVATALRMLQT